MATVDGNGGRGTIEILDPTWSEDTRPATLAPRPATLRGGVVALLSNGKAGVDPFFDHVERIIRERWQVAEVVRRSKPNYSAPAPAELITELVGWDAVLTGVGD
jgi:hypothetical protein